MTKRGKTADEIAKELFLSLKCVQNYMPYKRGMHQERVTANSKIAREKRKRMKVALDGQYSKFARKDISDRIQIDEKVLRNERERFENMVKNMGELLTKKNRPNISAKKYIPSILKLRFELVNYSSRKPKVFNLISKNPIRGIIFLLLSIDKCILLW